MALDARSRSSIYQNLVPILGEDDANALMSEFPSVEADELVTKQFLRAELATTLSAMDERFVTKEFLRAELAETLTAMDERFVTKELLRAELADIKVEVHRQTMRLGSGLAAATALLATLGVLT